MEKKKPFEDTYVISVDEENLAVLTSVSINLVWEDDVTYGIFSKKGLDTLTATVSYNGREQKNTTKGSGNVWFNFTINDIPEETIQAHNLSEAQKQLEERYSTKNSASFDVTVSIETGERLVRLLKYLKDKGNAFELKAEYVCYTLSNVEEKNSSGGSSSSGGSEGNPSEVIEGTGHGIGEFYRNLGYGRGMI
ncbi:MAG TPA: hypothetical protein ENG62_00205 [Thermoplasmatales archaeon]|nr:hypothetical protein [Thermoplasmatales archaeon]